MFEGGYSLWSVYNCQLGDLGEASPEKVLNFETLVASKITFTSKNIVLVRILVRYFQRGFSSNKSLYVYTEISFNMKLCDVVSKFTVFIGGC